jgi:hypothetical protein
VSASGLHLLAALVVVAGILVIKIMITAWAKVGGDPGSALVFHPIVVCSLRQELTLAHVTPEG